MATSELRDALIRCSARSMRRSSMNFRGVVPVAILSHDMARLLPG
jgi:hypothetical protein